MRNFTKIAAIAIAAAGVTFAPAAFAAPSTEVSVKIDTRYLETDWGVEKVYTKLENKARSACDTGSSRSPSARRFEHDCMSDLLDDFVANVDAEVLTAYHASITR